MRAEPDRAPTVYDGFDKLYINGKWRAGGTGRSGSDLDPWNGETLLDVALARYSRPTFPARKTARVPSARRRGRRH